MNRELLKPEHENSPPVKPRVRKQLWKPTHQQSNPLVDIALISGNAFHMNAIKSPHGHVFTTSIHELDALIEEHIEVKSYKTATANLVQNFHMQRRQRPSAAVIAAQILEIDIEPPVPDEYADYADVFSRDESNILPPHCPYNHKIQLEGKGEMLSIIPLL